MRRSSPERRVLSALRARGARPEEQVGSLPGRPDFVMRARRLIVFVDGCLWHGCDRCPPARFARNALFWAAKTERNRARDLDVRQRLRDAGWRVETVRECDDADRRVAEILAGAWR